MNHSLEKIDLNSVSVLVSATKAGDEAAREEICRQIQGYLHMMAARHLDERLKRKIDPADVVQQTLTQMIKGFEGFRGKTSKEFFGWLNKILLNEIRTLRRDLQRNKRDVGREIETSDPDAPAPQTAAVDPNLTPSSQAIQAEKRQRLNEILQRLPEDYAQVIQLRSLEELSFQEVSERMNKSYDSVTKLWYRAMVKFQEELDGITESQF